MPGKQTNKQINNLDFYFKSASQRTFNVGFLTALIKYPDTKPVAHKILNIYAKLTTLIEIKNKIHLLKII